MIVKTRSMGACRLGAPCAPGLGVYGFGFFGELRDPSDVGLSGQDAQWFVMNKDGLNGSADSTVSADSRSLYGRYQQAMLWAHQADAVRDQPQAMPLFVAALDAIGPRLSDALYRAAQNYPWGGLFERAPARATALRAALSELDQLVNQFNSVAASGYAKWQAYLDAARAQQVAQQQTTTAQQQQQVAQTNLNTQQANQQTVQTQLETVKTGLDLTAIIKSIQGSPATRADTGGETRILGMPLAVAIPVGIGAVGLLGVGAYFAFRKR